VQYRKLGTTGLEVSTLGFGAMRLPTLPGTRDVDERKAIQVIHRALDLGVNYIDTAYGYHGGQSEVVVGKAVKGRRDQLVISTKNPTSNDNGKEWRERLDTSLSRLDIDQIDLLLFHSVSWDNFSGPVSKPGGPFEEAKKARDEGLFKHLCFSCHDSPENVINLIDTGEFSTMTVQYNLLDRKNEGAIAHAHEKGMGVIIMGPVGGGRLAAASKFQDMIPGGAQSTPEIALRFVLANPAVSTALSGMNELSQVEENCATANRGEPLSQQETEQIRAALVETDELAKLYCTGCNYCMPCPNDVNISASFMAMNYHRVYGLTNVAKQHYRRISPDARQGQFKGERASDCLECGECEPKCPQNIPIMEQLKEVAATLGDE